MDEDTYVVTFKTDISKQKNPFFYINWYCFRFHVWSTISVACDPLCDFPLVRCHMLLFHQFWCSSCRDTNFIMKAYMKYLQFIF